MYFNNTFYLSQNIISTCNQQKINELFCNLFKIYIFKVHCIILKLSCIPIKTGHISNAQWLTLVITSILDNTATDRTEQSKINQNQSRVPKVYGNVKNPEYPKQSWKSKGLIPSDVTICHTATIIKKVGYWLKEWHLQINEIRVQK